MLFDRFSAGSDDVSVLSRNAISYFIGLESLRMLESTRDQSVLVSKVDKFWSLLATFRQQIWLSLCYFYSSRSYQKPITQTMTFSYFTLRPEDSGFWYYHGDFRRMSFVWGIVWNVTQTSNEPERTSVKLSGSHTDQCMQSCHILADCR